MLEKDLRKVFSSVELIAFDFDGVFTDNTVLVHQDGTEAVRCWRSDGIGLSRLRQQTGVKTYIVSTETNPVVTARANKLNIDCIQGVVSKDKAIKEICQKLGIPEEKTMFVGNDVNDVVAFKQVGIPVAVADAYPEVLEHVIYQTNKSGGFGAVREICDLICNIKSEFNK